jgi:hypothetical protein
MDRTRLIRGLRITVSAVFGIVCVLLIVLWVVSYWRRDLINYVWNARLGMYGAASYQGTLTFYFDSRQAIRNNARQTTANDPPRRPIETWKGQFADAYLADWFIPEGRNARSFQFIRHPNFLAITFSYWYLVPATGALAAAPCIRFTKRFSLRTLLIAATLIAAALGLIAYIQ